MSSSDGTELRQESATCVRCSELFPRITVWIGDRRLPGATALCPGCAAQEEREERAAAAAHVPAAQDATEALGKAGVNVRKHGACTLEGFDAHAAPRAIQAAREFVAEVKSAGRYDPVRGLYLCGPTGTGKTHLAAAIARELVGATSLLFDRASRLITEIQDTYGTGATAAVLERRENVGVWILDDFGAEKATDDALRILFDLLDAREGHPTVITSNFAPHELGPRWRESHEWARLGSRLAGQNFRAVAVGGNDRRFNVEGAA